MTKAKPVKIPTFWAVYKDNIVEEVFSNRQKAREYKQRQDETKNRKVLPVSVTLKK